MRIYTVKVRKGNNRRNVEFAVNQLKRSIIRLEKDETHKSDVESNHAEESIKSLSLSFNIVVFDVQVQSTIITARAITLSDRKRRGC